MITLLFVLIIIHLLSYQHSYSVTFFIFNELPSILIINIAIQLFVIAGLFF